MLPIYAGARSPPDGCGGTPEAFKEALKPSVSKSLIFDWRYIHSRITYL